MSFNKSLCSHNTNEHLLFFHIPKRLQLTSHKRKEVKIIIATTAIFKSLFNPTTWDASKSAVWFMWTGSIMHTHSTKLQPSKDITCWQVHCLTAMLYGHKGEIFVYLPEITVVIKAFDAELSLCQAGGCCRWGQKSQWTGHLTADITEQRISQTKCCSCLRLPTTLLSCLKRRISRSAGDPSAVQAVTLPCLTHTHTVT